MKTRKATFTVTIFLFIDATTDKNDAYNSYEEREQYLRKLAADKSCTDLPKPYEFPSATKQTTFVPSGGNVKQDHPVPKWKVNVQYKHMLGPDRIYSHP